MGRVVIRTARAGDETAIVGLIRRLSVFERASAPITLTEDAIRRDCFGPQPRFSVLLAERDGVLSGGMVLLDAYSSWAGAPTMVVHDLYVEEDTRGQGVGRALLAAAADLALARECCRLDVNVLAWNTLAQAFYRAQGFAPVDEWRPYRLDAEGIRRLVAVGANGRSGQSG